MKGWTRLFPLMLLLAGRCPAADEEAGEARQPLMFVPTTVSSEATADLVPLEDLSSERWNDKPVRVRGFVRNAFRDDIDPDFLFIVLQDGNSQAYAVCEHGETPISLVGSEIIVSGICRNTSGKGSRRYLSRMVFFSPTNEIQVVQASALGENVPVLDTTGCQTAEDVQNLGICKVVGRVLAVTGPDEVLLCTDKGAFVKVGLTDAERPVVDTVIEVVGFPATDFYFVNLTGARWHPSGAALPLPKPARAMTAAQLYTDYRGHTATPNVDYHGMRIVLTGVLRHRPSTGGLSAIDRPLLDDGGRLVPIICNACPDALRKVKVGSKLSLTGVCVVEVDNWYPGAPFPLVSGLALALASDDDVVVLQEPSWWTSGKLLLLVFVLGAVLLGIAVWNVLLQRKAEKRGRTLAQARLAQYGARLRLGERTRLAVELHDSLSQTLAGIAMEVGTAVQFSETASPDLVCHLTRASQTIDACRQELRNCLWDLRSHALEAPGMAEAIRLTLARTAAHVSLVIRFPVPRHYLSDNLVHNTLCIVRELVSNAIQHGRAAAVRIAGSLEAGRLLFSVSDNGGGFDPAKAPGVREGHFGLLGIRERVSRLNGELQIESRPGQGTRVRVALPLSQDGDKGDYEENQDRRRG